MNRICVYEKNRICVYDSCSEGVCIQIRIFYFIYAYSICIHTDILCAHFSIQIYCASYTHIFFFMYVRSVYRYISVKNRYISVKNRYISVYTCVHTCVCGEYAYKQNMRICIHTYVHICMNEHVHYIQAYMRVGKQICI